MKLLDRIAVNVHESSLRNSIRGHVLVGLSGGADSVALLHALLQLKDNGIHISAVHVNHGLRKSSSEDAAFCEALCRKLEIPLKVKMVSVSATGSIEASAREARYSAFYDTMKELNAETLALAHQADDQAETVLMHLLYGTGTSGLSGMQEYRNPVWRPLLGYRHTELVNALQEIRQSWCEDESNNETVYTRNYLRHCVIPQIEKAYPQAVRAINRTSLILQGEDEYVRDQAIDWLSEHGSKSSFHFIELTAFTSVHTALQRRILLIYAAQFGLHLEYSHVEELRAAAQSGKKVNLPSGWHAAASSSRLHFLPPHRNKVKWNRSDILVEPLAGNFGDGHLIQAAPAGLLEEAEIRTRQPGDRIKPFGMTGSMKLKDYFIAHNVDQPFRDSWPLLCKENEVLWVIGVGASQLMSIHNRGEAVLLRFIGKLPDSI